MNTRLGTGIRLLVKKRANAEAIDDSLEGEAWRMTRVCAYTS